MLISRRALLGWMLLRAHLGAECSRLEWTCLERTHGFYQGVPVDGERLRLEWLGKDIARVVIGVHLSHDNGAISNLGLSNGTVPRCVCSSCSPHQDSWPERLRQYCRPKW